MRRTGSAFQAPPINSVSWVMDIVIWGFFVSALALL